MIIEYTRLVSRVCGAVMLAALIALTACDTAEEAFNEHSLRAQALLEEGDIDKARVEFRSALQLDNESVPTLLGLANIAEQQGELRSAARYYAHALEEDTENLTASVGLARIHVLAGNAAEALELTRRVIERHPQHIRALTTHAGGLTLNGAFGSALVSVNQVLRIQPDDEEGLILLAWLLQNSKQPEAALQTLQKAVKLQPDSHRLIRNLAQLALFMEQHDLAIEAHHRLLKLLPNDPEQAYQMARLLLHLGRAEEAEQSMRERLQRMPDDLDAQLLLTESLVEQDRVDDAEQQVRTLLETRKGLPELSLLIADLYERSGLSQLAIAEYRDAASKHDGTSVGAAATVNVVRLLLARGEQAAARRLLNQLMKEQPGILDAQTLSGYLHLKEGNNRQAIAELRQAWRGGSAKVVSTMLATALWRNNEKDAAIELLQSEPDNVRTRYLLANFLRQRGDLDSARNIAAWLVERHSDFIGSHELQARLALDVKDWELAAKVSAEITTQWPQQALGHYLAAEASLGQDSKSTGEAHLRRALELAPNAIEPFIALFTLFVESQRFAAAEKLAKEILALKPEHALAQIMLGRVLFQQRQLDEANEVFAAAAERHAEWAEPWQWLMRVASANGNLSQVAHFAKLGQAHSDRLTIDSTYAQLLVKHNEMQAAVDVYRDLLNYYPQSVVPLNNLSMLLIQDLSDRRAISEARTLAARIDPGDDPGVLDTIAQVAAASCDFPQAISAHQRALRLYPGNQAYRLRLASAYLASGEQQRAAQELNKTTKNTTDSRNGLVDAQAIADRWTANCQPIDEEINT